MRPQDPPSKPPTVRYETESNSTIAAIVRKSERTGVGSRAGQLYLNDSHESDLANLVWSQPVDEVRGGYSDAHAEASTMLDKAIGPLTSEGRDVRILLSSRQLDVYPAQTKNGLTDPNSLIKSIKSDAASNNPDMIVPIIELTRRGASAPPSLAEALAKRLDDPAEAHVIASKATELVLGRHHMFRERATQQLVRELTGDRFDNWRSGALFQAQIPVTYAGAVRVLPLGLALAYYVSHDAELRATFENVPEATWDIPADGYRRPMEPFNLRDLDVSIWSDTMSRSIGQKVVTRWVSAAFHGGLVGSAIATSGSPVAFGVVASLAAANGITSGLYRHRQLTDTPKFALLENR